MVNDARGMLPDVLTILPVDDTYDHVTVSPCRIVPLDVKTGVVVPVPETYAAVYVFVPSVSVIPAPLLRLTATLNVGVKVVPFDETVALTTVGAPDGFATVLTGAIVSTPAIRSSPVKSTLPPGAARSWNAGTKPLPTGTDKNPSGVSHLAIACAYAVLVACVRHSSKKVAVL